MTWKDIVRHDVGMIQLYLSDIEEGANCTGNIKIHISELEGLFAKREMEKDEEERVKAR